MTTPQAYGALGIVPGASAAQVQAAYRKKALEFHPDRARSEEQSAYFYKRFLEIRDAYERLRREGFPGPEPEEVVPDVSTDFGDWIAGRSFAPKGPIPKAKLSDQLGLDFHVRPQTLVFWAVLVPGTIWILVSFLRFLLNAVRGPGH